MDLINLAIAEINDKLPGLKIKANEPFWLHTTFKVGGPVSAMLFPDSTEAVVIICDILNRYDISPYILGNGSNILASDENHEIIVINTSNLAGISVQKSCGDSLTKSCDIKADAGVLLSKLAVFAYENALCGLEFAHGIPGTVGGAVVMNAGAYGGEIKDVVYETIAYNTKNGVFTLTAADNEFSYRSSFFTKSNDILLSAVFRLIPGDKEKIKQKMDDLNERRIKSQPLDFASAGSTFKRPEEGYAAALIEQAGLKGFKIGGAKVSEKHSGFIVNTGTATYSDIMAVIDSVQEIVLKETGVKLEPEIKIVR